MSTNDAASEKVALDPHDLYENAPCGYHSVGADGTILRMNRTELSWLGYTSQELVGKRQAPPKFGLDLLAALFMKREIPSAGLLLMPQTGHTLNLEEPALFNAALLDFFHSVEQGRWPVR